VFFEGLADDFKNVAGKIEPLVEKIKAVLPE
jgi:hypothetical protein